MLFTGVSSHQNGSVIFSLRWKNRYGVLTTSMRPPDRKIAVILFLRYSSSFMLLSSPAVNIMAVLNSIGF